MQVSGQISTSSDRSYMFNTDTLIMFNDDVFDFIPILMPIMMDEEMKQVNLQSSTNNSNDDDKNVDADKSVDADKNVDDNDNEIIAVNVNDV